MTVAVVAAVATMGLATTAAAQSGFTDIDSSSHRANIETLTATGLFEGTECADEQFCPNEPAKRWAVAVWLVRALDGGDPPPVEESRFADVDNDEWWMPHVERMAQLEITAGCGTEPLRFCPDATVTRARMASFLVKAFALDEAPPAGFVDTVGTTHEANIDRLFASGITAGCKQDPLSFCPSRAVSRAQMATLIVRGLAHRAEASWFTIPEGPRGNDTLISAARGHTCAVRPDGGLACWGSDALLHRFALAGLRNVVAVSTGDNPDVEGHACVLHTDGTISCWGSGSYRPTRPGRHEPPLPAGEGSRNHRRGGSERGSVAHVCGPPRRQRLVLGRQPSRPAGRRHRSDELLAAAGSRPVGRGGARSRKQHQLRGPSRR